tara:strand:+ start:2560 stop:3480 length:921 start_codon:yes stop_codon:yes gene_type:complete
VKKIIYLFLALPFLAFSGEFQEDSTATNSLDSVLSTQDPETIAYFEKIKRVATMEYQTEIVDLGKNVATLTVPAGYKFLNSEDSKYVLTELWGNLPSETYGLIFPDTASPLNCSNTFVISLSYDESGYIEDDDAEDLDYQEILEGLIEDQKAANTERKAQGMAEMDLVGWAQTPFYDMEAKKLHWATEYIVEGYEDNVLNYDVKILGRKGMLTMSILGDVSVLPQIKENIDVFINSTEFKPGFTYAEFDPEFDDVAAYGIGGLIAGKVLAKAGIFVLLLKFWKVVALGFGAIVLGIKKFFGSKSEE